MSKWISRENQLIPAIADSMNESRFSWCHAAITALCMDDLFWGEGQYISTYFTTRLPDSASGQTPYSRSIRCDESKVFFSFCQSIKEKARSDNLYNLKNPTRCSGHYLVSTFILIKGGLELELLKLDDIQTRNSPVWTWAKKSDQR